MKEIILLLLGFIIIIKSADILVDTASSIALKFKIPKMLIALTIVSFGTCAPELAISFQSVSEGNGILAFSNVVGSCIVNVFLIIGVACIIRPIRVKHATIKKELPLLMLITLVFSLLMLDSLFNIRTDNIFSRRDGIILLSLFSIFVVYLIQMLFKKSKTEDVVETKYGVLKSIILFVISIVLIVFSSDLIVNNATILAERFNISKKVITMFTIVVGTSLPELFMTISSAKKGEFDMAIGNIIGTNIFNICVVLGLPVIIYGNVFLVGFGFIDILVLYLSSFLLYIFAKSEKTINKLEALIMVSIFIAYYIFILF